jgi:capsular exopolysaccharide synthesis family protein
MYRASGEVLVSEPSTDDIPFLDEGLSDNAERTLRNEVELLESRDTVRRIEAEVGRRLSVVASNDGESDVISLVSTNTEAAQAADDVNDFARTYVELRREDRREELETARQRVQADRLAAQEALQRLNAPVRALEEQLANTPPGPDRDNLINQRDAARDATTYQRTALNNEITELGQDIDRIDGSIQLTSGGIRVITEADVPGERYTPQPKKDALLAATIALMIGLILAFVAEFAFDRLNSQEDIEEALPDERFLGAIPRIDVFAGDRSTGLLPFGQEQSNGEEAYRALAASIEFARLEKPVKVIHLTSPVAGEGKSTTAANLAAAFAETGARVAMADADVRRPVLYRILGDTNDVGLSSVLLGRASLSDALQDVPSLPGVKLLSPGPVPPNPTKMLYARRTEEVFDELRANFDVVLVDGPPVLPVADALILTQFSDMTIVIVRAGSTRRRSLRRARHALARVESASLGIVLNDASIAGVDGYGYYGQYQAAQEDEGDTRLGGLRRRLTTLRR